MVEFACLFMSDLLDCSLSLCEQIGQSCFGGLSYWAIFFGILFLFRDTDQV